MPFRIVPDRRLVPLIAAVEALFWLPMRLLARLAGMRGGRDRGHAPSALLGVANDNLRPLGFGPRIAANSNTPRRLA
ncbi:MAG: hypothetical protein AB7O45_08245 [Alphaproteobacteria bacterium]